MAVRKTYRAYTPWQELILPPNIQDWVPEGHLARFISDAVDEIDLSAIFAEYEKGVGRGQPPYHPAMMMKLLIYGYCTGIRSSRAIERATYDIVPFRMLSGDQHPDHDSIASFRRRHFEAFSALFVETVRVSREAGLVDLAHVSVDGSKVKANASRHKAMSYDRMQEAEKQLQSEVDRIMAEAEAIDAEEDAKYGKGRRGDELPEELRRREDRLKKIREAKKRLEDRAREAAAERARKASENAEKRHGADSTEEEPPAGGNLQCPNPEEARPDPKAQCNFTDHESRIMKDGATKSFVQAYNPQIAVDSKLGFIVGTLMTQAANDVEQLAPTVAEVTANCGVSPEKVSADTGYYSDSAMNDERLNGIDLYIATGREKKTDEGLRKRQSAISTRLLSLMLTLCISTIGSPTASLALTTVTPLAAHRLPLLPQLTRRQKRSRLLLGLASIVTTYLAFGSTCGVIGLVAPVLPVTLHRSREHMRRKLQTEAGKSIYRRRKAIVEAPFGSIKEVQRVRTFLVRGLAKVTGEWNLVTACHNLLKMFRHGKEAAIDTLRKRKEQGLAGALQGA